MEPSELDGKRECARYYLKGSLMEVEEDRTHEFKGHRNISIEEIPPWCVDVKDNSRKTRNAISRNICGFLNSGLGGTIYLGVLDSGEIEGIPLTIYQRDHVKACLINTLERFNPPVPKHLYSITFVPCIAKGDVNSWQTSKSFNCMKTDNTPQEKPDLKEEDNEEENGVNCKGWDWNVEPNEKVLLPQVFRLKYDPLRSRPHTLQTYRYCWCDDDAFARYCHGHKSPVYIAEIVIKPPSAKDPEIRKYLHPRSELYMQPIFQAEDGSIYLRRHASLARRSLSDMTNDAVEEVQRKYFPVLKEAKIQLGILQALIEAFELLELKSKCCDENTSENEK